MNSALIRALISLLLILTLAFSLVSCVTTPDEEPIPGEDEEKTNDDAKDDDKEEIVIIPTGNKIGNLAHDAEVDLASGTGKVKISDLRGKVVVINFWGTWCNPCKEELPHFDEVAEKYKDDVAVVAIHSSFDSLPMNSYINNNYKNSNIIFAKDSLKAGSDYVDAYYNKLGGNGSYPLTVILDADGVITFKQIGMLSYDELVGVVEAAGAKAPTE